MNTTRRRLRIPARRQRLAGPPATSLALSVLAGLAGCAYLDAMEARVAPPDQRIQLGPRDHVSLYRHEIPDHTCQGLYLLRCDRGGAVTYLCRCVLR